MAKLPVSRCRLRLTVSDAVGGEVRQQRLELAGTLGFALRIDTRHAGVQTVQPGKGRVCDALGLFSLQLRLPDACSIAVEPEPQEPPVLPNLSHFQYRSYHPKPGGGFSEIHDLREYRPGDSLLEIHWKLSAKTDKLIVREAEEPDLGLVVLGLRLFRNPHAAGQHAAAAAVAFRLADRKGSGPPDRLDRAGFAGAADKVRQNAGRSAGAFEHAFADPSDRQYALACVRAYPHADWRYHVQPEEQEVQQA